MHILVAPSENRGRRECRVHAAPTALRANEKDAREANTGTPKSPRHSLRNGFTAAPCSSWCAGLFSHHRSRRDIRKLDSSIGEPEPHGLTVRVSAHHLTR